jgi:hypothetical protein
VSEPLLPRVPIAASALARRLIRSAAALSLFTGLMLALAAALPADAVNQRLLLGTLALVAGGAASVLLRRGATCGAEPGLALAIDSDGRLLGWRAAQEAPTVLRARSISPWVLVLVPAGSPAGSPWTVWRDSLPPAAFRRLGALARWQLQRTASGSNPGGQPA